MPDSVISRTWSLSPTGHSSGSGPKLAVAEHCYHLVAIGSPVSSELVDSVQLLDERCLQELASRFSLTGTFIGLSKPNANEQVG